jgi:hypothetical protein
MRLIIVIKHYVMKTCVSEDSAIVLELGTRWV